MEIASRAASQRTSTDHRRCFPRNSHSAADQSAEIMTNGITYVKYVIINIFNACYDEVGHFSAAFPGTGWFSRKKFLMRYDFHDQMLNSTVNVVSRSRHMQPAAVDPVWHAYAVKSRLSGPQAFSRHRTAPTLLWYRPYARLA